MIAHEEPHIVEINLAPCPFCGGQPMAVRHPPHRHFLVDLPPFEGCFTIECVSCQVHMLDDELLDIQTRWNGRSGR